MEEKKGEEKRVFEGLTDRGVSERQRRGVAGVRVIRASRTLSDRNGAIIRGSRDVKRSALCVRRAYV